jgi:hypothetical protein
MGASKMARIKLENLDISGLDLFNDSESFIVELTDEEQPVVGGINVTAIHTTRSMDCCCAGFTAHDYSRYCSGNDLFPLM